MTMAMLDDGTQKLSALQISDTLAQLGARLSASSSLDESSVSLSALREQLDPSLALFADVVLTPSSLAYETMTLDDLVVCDLEGNVIEGERHPTTEKMLHLACPKAYDDIHSVIHCHAKFCTMFALTHQPIPCCIEEVEAFVGARPVVIENDAPDIAVARGDVASGQAISRHDRRSFTEHGINECGAA